MSNRRSPKEWSQLLSLYASRDCTQEAFCKRHGISPASLKYHLDRSTPAALKFVPALSTPISSQEISVELPSGIKLTIRG